MARDGRSAIVARRCLLSSASVFSSLCIRLGGSTGAPALHGGGGGSLVPVRSVGTLAYEEVSASSEGVAPASTALVLHGLLGSGRNWKTFSRNLAAALASSSPTGRYLAIGESLSFVLIRSAVARETSCLSNEELYLLLW